MINILTGRQADPLQEELLDQAAKTYLAGQEVFILVPNHIKFNTEVRVIAKVAELQERSETSVKNLHVLSFSRLAWFFFKKADISLPQSLDDAAASMILEQIINKRKKELNLFKNTHPNSGMIQQVYQTILQVHTGQLDLDELLENAANPAVEASLDTETSSKLHDLKIIYQDFLDLIQEKNFATKDELNIQLNEVLASHPEYVQKAAFYVTDFSHFSLQEKQTIQLLAAFCQDLTLGFKTEFGDIHAPLAGEYDYVVQKTIKDLTGYFGAHGLDYQSDQLEEKATSATKLNSAWIANEDADLTNLQLVKADSRYAEVYFAARTIYSQVATKQYQYCDFLILAPNLAEYETYLAPIFRQNQIPFFDDLQQMMKYHPLVILIEDLAKLAEKTGDTAAMIGLMKTRLIIPAWYQEQEDPEAAYLRDVDQLENFVLAHGIKYKLWEKSFSDFTKASVIYLDQEKYQRRLERLDKLRDFFVSQVNSLVKKLKDEQDSLTGIKTFFSFLVKTGVSSQLESWRKKASDDGKLQEAKQPEEVWNSMLGLLQDYLLVNPEKFDWQSFFSMLTAGFSQAAFATIPATLDAVTISEYGMVQSGSYKQVIIIGANNGSLPQISDMKNFLTPENLKVLEDFFAEDAYLEDQQELNNIDQDYQFGAALALASERVYVSYPVINSDNERLEPSIYYQRLLKLVNGREYRQRDLPSLDESEVNLDLLLFMTTPAASLGYLTYAAEGMPQSLLVKKLLDLCRQDLPAKTKAVEEGIDYDNNPENISEELAEKLYGKDLLSSVSQLETFYQNSFEYFVKYGLRLSPRAENELNAVQSGNYFHRTFELLVKEMQKRGLEIEKMSELELELLLKDVRQEIWQEPIYQQFLRDPFNQYLFKTFDKTTSKVAQTYRVKQQENRFKATFAELPFGPAEKVAGLILPLKKLAGKRKISLRGKIDRVDLFKGDKHVLAQLIDYKSSSHSFNPARFANGIDLQMIAYLDVLVKNQSQLTGTAELDLLGAFYQYVTRKLNPLNGSGSNSIFDANFDLKQAYLGGQDKLRLNGVAVNDPVLFSEVDQSLKTGSSSYYRGASVTKKGTFKSSDSFYSKEEMNLLLEYVEYLIENAAEGILEGQIALNPFRQGGQNGLTYTDYKDIYYFDEQLPTNHYHDLGTMHKTDLLTQVRSALNMSKEE